VRDRPQPTRKSFRKPKIIKLEKENVYGKPHNFLRSKFYPMTACRLANLARNALDLKLCHQDQCFFLKKCVCAVLAFLISSAPNLMVFPCNFEKHVEQQIKAKT